jgi:DNA-binding response OmpR family regulator
MDCKRVPVLVVEDDSVARTFLADNLTADGFEVIATGSQGAAIYALRHHLPHVAVVDLGLPDGDGLELIRFVRESDRVAGQVDPDLPIIVLSGRGSEVERLRGFRNGADDYLVKPFSLLELTARLEALLRRAGHRPAGSRWRVGPLELDLLARQAWLHGEPLALSVKEWGLLRVLASDPGRAFTRGELISEVWGYEPTAPTRTVDAHASRLRHKLAARGDSFVINVWGVGYRLVDSMAR